MKSPFPGMDPYIEASNLWGDFHSHLIEKIYEEISALLPEGYVARTNERSYIALLESVTTAPLRTLNPAEMAWEVERAWVAEAERADQWG